MAGPTPAPSLRPTPFPTPKRIATPEQTPRPTPERAAEDDPNPTATRSPQQPAVFTIINRQFIVPARHFVPVRFRLVVPSTISGQFQAYGGNNDIAVAIMSEEEFENYRNGGYYRAYYNTGYITSDTPTVNLPPGTYYLTFDDRKAVIIGKTVIARFVATRRD